MEVRAFAKASFGPMFAEFGIDMVPLPGMDYEFVFTDADVRMALATGSTILTNLAIHRVLQREYDEIGSLDRIVDGLLDFKPTVIIWNFSLVIEAMLGCVLCKCPGICLAFTPVLPTEEMPCVGLCSKHGNEVGWFNRFSHWLIWSQMMPLAKSELFSYIQEKYGVLLGGSDAWEMYSSPRRATICGWSSVLGPRPKDYHSAAIGPVGSFGWSDREQQSCFKVPESLAAFVKDVPREQLAYISWGSMGAGSDEALAELAVGALQLAGVEGVVQGGYSDLRRESIRDSKLRAYAAKHVHFIAKGASVPHNWLFPRCGVCVHHGGVGTVTACLLAGTPSVVTPVYTDQFYWAHRIAEMGVGLQGPALASATPALIADCVRKCLADLATGGGQMAAKVAAAGQLVQAEDGVGRAADYVERFCCGMPPGADGMEFVVPRGASHQPWRPVPAG